MNQKANFIKVGIFACAALALVIWATMLFGSGAFFSHTKDFVLFFDASVNGLEEGAAVKFKGVKIGEVNDILLRLNNDGEKACIPVVIRVDTSLLIAEEVGKKISLEDAVAHGLRGKLEYQSYLTGRLFVELDYGTKEVFHNNVEDYKGKLVIPTESANLKELWVSLRKAIEKIAKVDFAKAFANFEATSTRIREGVEQMNFKDISHNFIETSQALRDFVKSRELKGLTLSANNVLQKTDHLVKQLTTLTAPTGPFSHNLTGALETIKKAAEEVRVFLEYLKRNPNALLTGGDNR